MPLYFPVYETDFYDEAKKYDAEFSHDALDALYEYYDNEPEFIEVDLVKIKNEWTEYDTYQEAMEALILMNNGNETVEDKSEDECKEYVENSGYTYLECENGHVLVKDGVW